MEFRTHVVVTDVDGMTITTCLKVVVASQTPSRCGFRTRNGQSQGGRRIARSIPFKTLVITQRRCRISIGVAMIFMFGIAKFGFGSGRYGIIVMVFVGTVPLVLPSLVVLGGRGQARSDATTTRFANVDKNEGRFRPMTTPVSNPHR
jgi:hypothetical protein